MGEEGWRLGFDVPSLRNVSLFSGIVLKIHATLLSCGIFKSHAPSKILFSLPSLISALETCKLPWLRDCKKSEDPTTLLPIWELVVIDTLPCLVLSTYRPLGLRR